MADIRRAKDVFIQGVSLEKILKKSLYVRIDSTPTEIASQGLIDLSSHDLSQVFFEKSKLKRCKLTNTNFQSSIINDADFSFSSLKGACFDDVEINNCDLNSATLESASFNNSKINNSIFRNTVLSKAEFNSARISNSIFSSSKLIQAYFMNTRSDSVVYDNSNMRLVHCLEAYFYNSSFVEVDLQEANCRASRFEQSNLLKVNFNHANLNRTDLSLAENLTSDQIKNAHGDENTLLPKSIPVPLKWVENNQSGQSTKQLKQQKKKQLIKTVRQLDRKLNTYDQLLERIINKYHNQASQEAINSAKDIKVLVSELRSVLKERQQHTQNNEDADSELRLLHVELKKIYEKRNSRWIDFIVGYMSGVSQEISSDLAIDFVNLIYSSIGEDINMISSLFL